MENSGLFHSFVLKIVAMLLKYQLWLKLNIFYGNKFAQICGRESGFLSRKTATFRPLLMSPLTATVAESCLEISTQCDED